MNQQAERHLAKAEGFLAKGDAWYAKAADEIIAAKEADSQLSNKEIGERFGHSHTWVGSLVRWRTSGTSSFTPFSRDAQPGRDEGVRRAETKRFMREASVEEVAEIIKQRPEAVSKALAEDDGFAFDAMTDPQARLNAGAAGHKHQEAARAQVQSEEKARNKDLMSEKEYDGLLLLQLGQAGGEIVQAARTFARTWSKNVGDLSEEGRELAVDLLARQQIEINKILDAARGADDLDAVLAEILG